MSYEGHKVFAVLLFFSGGSFIDFNWKMNVIIIKGGERVVTSSVKFRVPERLGKFY